MKQTRVNKVSHEIITKRYVRWEQVSRELRIKPDQLRYFIKLITGHELLPAKGKPGKITVEEYKMVGKMIEFQKDIPELNQAESDQIKILRREVEDLKAAIKVYQSG